MNGFFIFSTTFFGLEELEELEDSDDELEESELEVTLSVTEEEDDMFSLLD